VGTGSVTDKSSSGSIPFGKPGSGSLIFSGIGMGGPPADCGGVAGTGGVSAASGNASAGLGMAGAVGSEGAWEVGGLVGVFGAVGAGAVTFGIVGAAPVGPTGMASIGSTEEAAESAGKLASFAIIACTCAALAGSEAMLFVPSGSATLS
jgi:hypothetical protein